MATTVHQGACPLDCPDTCAWQVTVTDGLAVTLRGDRAHPFTRGGLCHKVNHYLEGVYDPERLVHPYVRVGPKGTGAGPAAFRRASWDEAVARAAAGITAAIDRHGPEAVLPYHYAGTMGHVQGWSLGNRLFAHLGASRLGYTICSAASGAALESLLGAKVGLEPQSVAHADLVVLWGANVTDTNIHQWHFVRQALDRGAHLVVVDPVRTEVAARAHEHLAPLPGTDAALALGLMRVILDAGGVDKDWVGEHTDGWPELEARLGEWPVERAAAETGLDVEIIEQLGRRIATTRPTAIRCGLGMQRHAGAGQAMRAVLAIPLLTGDYQYPGGGAFGSVSGHHQLNQRAARAPADLPTTPARTVNMSRLAEALVELDDPPIEAMVVYSANPAATVPDQARLRRGLGRAELFVVVAEQRWTDTCDWADVVLPATMQVEHLDLHDAYGHHFVALNRPAIAPVGEALPTNEIMRRLAAALGLDHPRLFDDDEAIVAALLDGSGIDVAELDAVGWVRATGVEPGATPYAEGGFPTPSGRARLVDDRLGALGVDPLIGYTPPAEVADRDLAARYPLALVSPAGRYFLNSTFAGQAWHEARIGAPAVHLHPDDAAARAIGDGDRVRVHNDRGAFEAIAIVDERTRPGVACTPKAYWPRRSADGWNVNATTPVRDADLGGAPTFHDNRVEVARL